MALTDAQDIRTGDRRTDIPHSKRHTWHHRSLVPLPHRLHRPAVGQNEEATAASRTFSKTSCQRILTPEIF